MKLRFYAAIVTGMLVEILTLGGLYFWSSMELGGMVFCSVWAYILGMAAVMYVTEQKQPQRRIREPQIYNLKEEGWNERKVC